MLSLVLLLGACAQTFQQCVRPEVARLSTSGAENLAPGGCVATEIGTKGLKVLDCQGGREGFLFESLAPQ